MVCLGEVESGNFFFESGARKGKNKTMMSEWMGHRLLQPMSQGTLFPLFTPPARHQDRDAPWETKTASQTPLAARFSSPCR